MVVAVCVAAIAMLSGCQSWRPSNDRNWSPDQAVLPYAEINGHIVDMHRIRNCKYKTASDYTVRHYDKQFDLDELDSVDYIVCPFSDVQGVAHTFLSFGFAGHDYLAVSVEIRKERGEVYRPLTGLLRQFEIMYVVADERDLIGLRTNFRREEVFVYRVRASHQAVRRLFADVMERVNKLHDQPEFYNTLTNNCTTNILRHVNRIASRKVPYGYEVLLPGYSDKLAYDLGLLDTVRSFSETRERARVNELAYVHRNDPEFSVLIRR